MASIFLRPPTLVPRNQIRSRLRVEFRVVLCRIMPNLEISLRVAASSLSHAPISPVTSPLLVLEAGLSLSLGLSFRRRRADRDLFRRLVAGARSCQHRGPLLLVLRRLAFTSASRFLSSSLFCTCVLAADLRKSYERL